MPWQTPTLREVRSLVRDNLHSSLPGSDATVPNSVLRVLSDNQGGLCHLVLQYIDWLALQLLPDTAEKEWLDRHGDIWLTNSDGTTGRKVATLSEGSVMLTGTGGTVVPVGTRLISSQSLEFETIEEVTLSGSAPTPVAVRALDPGAAGNLQPDTNLAISSTVLGLDAVSTVVELHGGTDEESDDDLRIRVLERIRQPPMGGAEHDYVRWAKAVPGVTRAWAAVEMGVGTITVRFLMDDLHADNDGFPNDADILAVKNYIDTVRPVTVKDCFVVAPIKEFINVTILDVAPQDDATKAEIEASIRAMLFEKAAPGVTIYAAWISHAIMNAPSVVSFSLITTDDYVMPSVGHMAVLGTILYEETPEPPP